MLNAGRVVAAV